MEKKNNSFGEIWGKLKSSKRVLMTLHSGPDGDSLGACTAMKYVLERDFGCEVRLISGDELSKNLASLEMADDVEIGKDISDVNFGDFDVFLALDTATSEMLGRYKKGHELPKDLFVINIDHHITNSYYGDLNYISASKSSACSILFDFLRDGGVKFDSKLSESLLLGICTDTGFFQNERNDMKDIFKEVSFLVENGADYMGKIVRPILYEQPLSLKKFFALLITGLKIDKERKIAWSIVDNARIKDLGLNKADIRSGINYISNVEGIDLVFNLVDIGECIKGSFRSLTGVDTTLIAKELGGGGHKAASGFMLDRSIGLEEAEKKVFEAIEKVGIHKQ